MGIDTMLSLAGLGFGVHGAAGGVSLGNKTDKVLQHLKNLDVKVERLSEGLLYADTVSHVKDISIKQQQLITDIHEIRDILEPIQRSTGERILASSHIKLPTLTHAALDKDPWEVMFEVRPLNRVKLLQDPDSVPILFNDSGTFYVGWQKKGILPSVFGCEFNNNGFYFPTYLNTTSQNQVSNRENCSSLQCDSLKAVDFIKEDQSVWVPRETTLNRGEFLFKYTNRVDYD